MHKYLVTSAIAALILFNVSITAQVRITPGVMTGIGIFNEKTSASGGSSSSGTIVGGVGGAILDIPVSENVSLRPGLVFSSRGGGPYLDQDNMQHTFHLSYLAIPIDLKLHYQASPMVIPYAIIGTNLGFLLAASDHVENPGVGSGTIDAGFNYNPVDFGFNIGAGAEFPKSDLTPFFELSYYFGVVSTYSNLSVGTSVTNAGIDLRIGLKFKPELISKIL